MLSGLMSAIRTPDVRKKILITLGFIALYRAGAALPAPGVNYGNVSKCVEQVTAGDNASIYSLINLFSGGALLHLSVFAIGIMPYITASIIIQLLQVVIPRFEELKKEGESGQAKLSQYTRYLSVALSILQATGVVALAARGQLLQGCSLPILESKDSVFGMVIIVLVMTAGAALVMWFGEIITERGIGQGMSLLIFAGIAARIPAEGQNILEANGGLVFTGVVVAILAIVAVVVYVESGQRRTPVQYSKRMVGRKMYGGSSTYIPLKVNPVGVIPVIFASSLLYLPNLITQITSSAGSQGFWQKHINPYLTNPSSPVYIALYFAMIVFFTYFYVAIQINPEERADDMKKYGGFIPGIRPGQPTADYLSYVLNRITLPGSIYLGAVAVLPNLFLNLGTSGQNLPFGGTSVLIMVSVGLETVKQIQSQLIQRNYEGFLK